MKRTDFSVPQHMSPGAFFIIFVKLIKALFGPILLCLLINVRFIEAEDGSIWLRAAASMAGLTVICLLLAMVSYYSKKFYVSNGNLIYVRGVIRRENISIPLERIHSLRTCRGLWYRLLGMRGVVFDTLAAKGEEIELILSETDWNSLISLIENEERQKPASASEPPEYNPKSSIFFDDKNLALAALCQNHLKGLAVLGVIFAPLIDNIGIFGDDAKVFLDHTGSFLDETINTPLSIAVALILLYFAAMLLWLGKVFLKYYDMSMTFDRKQLTFSYGLISRSSSRFTFNKICTIRVKRNPLEQRFKFCTLWLRQALNASAEKEEDNLRIYGADNSDFFLQWWLGQDYKNSMEMSSAVSGPAVYLRAMRRTKVSLRKSYIQITGGRIAKNDNYIKYSNVEVVRLRRTPLTRLFHRATLVIATSGSSFTVRSLREQEAERICELILSYAESPKKIGM